MLCAGLQARVLPTAAAAPAACGRRKPTSSLTHACLPFLAGDRRPHTMAPPKQQRLVSLEERTDRHPQLKGRAPCPQIALSQVAAALADGAYYLGAGSFCRVWGVSSWDGGPAAARGQPVVSW